MLIFSLAWISNVCWVPDFVFTNTMLSIPLYTSPLYWHHHNQSPFADSSTPTPNLDYCNDPFDGRKIHHHVTPVTDRHSIIHHGVPKFPASISSMSREGPMLIEMTRPSTDTLGISISLQIKLYLPPAAEIDDMYDSFAWAPNAPI